jgi:hypothetical protein
VQKTFAVNHLHQLRTKWLGEFAPLPIQPPTWFFHIRQGLPQSLPLAYWFQKGEIGAFWIESWQAWLEVRCEKDSPQGLRLVSCVQGDA